MSREFAFDVSLRAVARVTAETEAEARAALDGLEAIALPICQCYGPLQVSLSEASLAHEPGEAHLIQDSLAAAE